MWQKWQLFAFLFSYLGCEDSLLKKQCCCCYYYYKKKTHFMHSGKKGNHKEHLSQPWPGITLKSSNLALSCQLVVEDVHFTWIKWLQAFWCFAKTTTLTWNVQQMYSSTVRRIQSESLLNSTQLRLQRWHFKSGAWAALVFVHELTY